MGWVVVHNQDSRRWQHILGRVGGAGRLPNIHHHGPSFFRLIIIQTRNEGRAAISGGYPKTNNVAEMLTAKTYATTRFQERLSYSIADLTNIPAYSHILQYCANAYHFTILLI